MAATDEARKGQEDHQGGSDETRENAARAAQEQLEDAQEGAEGAKESASGAVDAAASVAKGGKEGSKGMLKTVVGAARDAATEVLEREARAGAQQAAEYLAKKAPELAQDRLQKAGGGGPAARAAVDYGKAKLEGAGGTKAILSAAGGAAKGVVDKVKPGGDGGGKDKGLGETRRLPIECSIDVAAPVETVYNQWTQFEDSPQYMHRIQQVSQGDDTELQVSAKIWGITRSWKVEISEQIPNERLAWRTEGGSRNSGVVTFHRLDDRLTRVMVVLDFPPEGVMEKMASGLRLVKRATHADLRRFRAFVEMRDEETGAWRGRIEEGDVVDEEPQDREEDYEEEEEYEEEPEAETEEEPEAEEEPAAEAEEEEEEEPEAPRRRQQPRRQRTRRQSGSTTRSKAS